MDNKQVLRQTLLFIKNSLNTVI